MSNHSSVDLSNEQLNLQFDLGPASSYDRLAFTHAPSWLASKASPLFTIVVDGQTITARTGGVVFRQAATADSGGTRSFELHFADPSRGLEITHHVVVYAGTALFETWQTVRNTSAGAMQITRLDSIALDLVPDSYELLFYTSGWGSEFDLVRVPIAEMALLETRHGRSSKGQHPWFALVRPDGGILSASVAWSGNWTFRFAPNGAGGTALSGGLHDWEFSYELAPGATIESPPVALVLGEQGDLNTISTQYARVGRRHWYPDNARARQVPVEWNHWWPYEDRFIDEQVFRANVDVAARMGVEVCTLDAGWFGPIAADSHWYDYRGDWATVNTARFPSGIRALAEYVHERGMAFGIWCEIEALGQHAQLAEQHPAFVATRNGERLGYVCFGNPATQEWAFATLSRLISEHGADWIKLDFNLDPQAGCDRIDHGHGVGDGLYAHYQGYYQTLERLRARYPEVTLENCSSGGLRIDLGMLRHTIPTFLSDPDWPAHGLQLIWGASTMMAPNAWLHWGYSEWINGHPPQQFNPRDPQLKAHQLDYYVRIGMLGAFGLSQKLPDLPAWVAERYTAHIALYRETLRRFVREADFYRLTDQPRRDGGSRWAAFQYTLPDDSEHVIAAFRLPDGEPARTLTLYRLDPEREYTLFWLQTERVERRHGAALIADGLRIDDLPEQGSALVLLR
ncbi:MAG: alpha-galactosidase [Roseiflexaceae bacterium]|nr:alpha-galactosidase [Roseiflexaceae bacterium]